MRVDVAVIDPPRAGLSQKVVRRVLEARPSGSSTCRATPPRSLPTRARWWTPGMSYAACSPWTCSPRRRISSAWRCSRASPPGAGVAARRPAQAAESRRPPVVVLVLDEFPTDSLTDAAGHIDAGRFPAFASLAGDATWFRNAWSVYDSTPQAVPAILTGNVPDGPRPPSWRRHRQSLFSVLAGAGYGMRPFEEATAVCPPRLCPRTEGYGQTRDNLLYQRPARLRRTIASIRPRRRPTLYFHHSLLPHVPWSFGPSGKGRQGFASGSAAGLRRARGLSLSLPHRPQPAAPPAPGGLCGPRARPAPGSLARDGPVPPRDGGGHGRSRAVVRRAVPATGVPPRRPTCTRWRRCPCS